MQSWSVVVHKRIFIAIWLRVTSIHWSIKPNWTMLPIIEIILSVISPLLLAVFRLCVHNRVSELDFSRDEQQPGQLSREHPWSKRVLQNGQNTRQVAIKPCFSHLRRRRKLDGWHPRSTTDFMIWLRVSALWPISLNVQSLMHCPAWRDTLDVNTEWRVWDCFNSFSSPILMIYQ